MSDDTLHPTYGRCCICGEETVVGADDIPFGGDPTLDVPSGRAHDACAEASASVMAWLAWSWTDGEKGAPTLPVDEMAEWLRDGGKLGETHTLALLDEIAQERKERRDAKAARGVAETESRNARAEAAALTAELVEDIGGALSDAGYDMPATDAIRALARDRDEALGAARRTIAERDEARAEAARLRDAVERTRCERDTADEEIARLGHALTAAYGALAGVRGPACADCGSDKVTCFGLYDPGGDGRVAPTYACDECCGHGNEDGWCRPVGEG